MSDNRRLRPGAILREALVSGSSIRLIVTAGLPWLVGAVILTFGARALPRPEAGSTATNVAIDALLLAIVSALIQIGYVFDVMRGLQGERFGDTDHYARFLPRFALRWLGISIAAGGLFGLALLSLTAGGTARLIGLALVLAALLVVMRIGILLPDSTGAAPPALSPRRAWSLTGRYFGRVVGAHALLALGMIAFAIPATLAVWIVLLAVGGGAALTPPLPAHLQLTVDLVAIPVQAWFTAIVAAFQVALHRALLAAEAGRPG